MVTLYRFKIDLSDIDRGVYEALDFRVAMHPSETTQFLLTRVLAYALNYQSGLEFSPGGLSDTDDPALRVLNPNGGMDLCIEIGNPSARRLHKSSKASREVRVYTYKDTQTLLKELRSEDIHRLDEIGVYAFAPEFLNRLAEHLEKDNRWSVLHNEGLLDISTASVSESGEVRRLSVLIEDAKNN